MSLLPWAPALHDLYNARTIPDSRLIYDYKTFGGYQMLASFEELQKYDDRQTDGYLLYQTIQIYDITSLAQVAGAGNNSHRIGLFTEFDKGSLGWTCTYNSTQDDWACIWSWVPPTAFNSSPMSFDRVVPISRHLGFVEHEQFDQGVFTTDKFEAFLLLPPDETDYYKHGETEHRFSTNQSYTQYLYSDCALCNDEQDSNAPAYAPRPIQRIMPDVMLAGATSVVAAAATITLALAF